MDCLGNRGLLNLAQDGILGIIFFLRFICSFNYYP